MRNLTSAASGDLGRAKQTQNEAKPIQEEQAIGVQRSHKVNVVFFNETELCVVIDVLVAVLFLGLGIGIILWSYVMGRQMPGDLEDSRFNFAVLEFFYRALSAFPHGHLWNFLDAPFFYPWPRVTNFSDTFWGDGEVYALARVLGMGPLRSFQTWFVAGFVLTYATAFVSFRRLGLASWGAATGALMFAFPLPLAAQFGHVQLVYRLWVPPAIVAFDHFLTRQSVRAGAACILFVALQLAASIYLGLFLCLFLASYGAALCFVRRGLLAPPGPTAFHAAGFKQLVTTAILLLAAAITLAVVGLPYLDVQFMYGFTRMWSDVAQTLPRPGSYLLAGASTLWPNLSGSFSYPLPWEHQLFPGLSAIIPITWFVLSRDARVRHPRAGVMLVALAILFALTLSVDGYTLYRLIYLIPGFSAVRVVTRVILVMMLPLAVLFGLLIDDLTARGPHRLARLCVALALSGFLIAECSFIRPDGSTPSSWQARLEALKAHLPVTLPRNAILAIAGPSLQPSDPLPWTLTQTDAEVAAVSFGIQTLNGYSGNFPLTWKTLTTCSDVRDNVRAGRHFLAVHGLPVPNVEPGQVVLVGFGHCDLAGLDRDPELQLGRVYRLAEGADGNAFVDSGFSFPESWGRWTDSNDASLYFSLAASPLGRTSVEVEARTFSSAPDQEQEVAVTANAHSCGQFDMSAGRPHAKVVCPDGALRNGSNSLRFHLSHPARPVDLGVGDDYRYLGLGLEAFVLRSEE